ncbi:hypothetical protein L6164_022730 [Bauhinia variegata]|uniref:Uncharacterized protein n=1 Tax=Bauhinia variegata TaxID=167791 RepID=A0ACB9MG53_BAUVA|nr:hypothetical protein L6164_022730 [Bauhinia variegata]
MAHVSQLPLNADGVCMLCKAKPTEETEKLICKTCTTPWHSACLVSRPETLAEVLQWECPDCSAPVSDLAPVAASDALLDGAGGGSSELLAAIRAIEADNTLTEQEKARKRQRLMNGKAACEDGDDDDEKSEDDEEKKDGNGEGNDMLNVLSETFKCSFCMQLPERPVTTPCGHNFCLKCFQKWIGQGKQTCAKCRSTIPPKMSSQPRINSALVAAIRMAKISKSVTSGEPAKVFHCLHNQDRPDTAYTTERAQKTGKANAASGKIFVTVPQDHFGPITADYDPVQNRGVLVGDSWEDRLECRQWGAHFPHVSGIAGQSNHGAQSVVLSGGYVDDEDHGEWFLYTGSGGRDLSGNKRTNKEQSFDQKFEKSNKALQVSCLKGYPVRVVRSHKEKRSSYAPEKGLRYDGVYRIEKCWQKVGLQGFKVCRYLFIRCDNEPAPWTSDDHGDRPRPLPVISELKKVDKVYERKETPSWDFNEKDSRWKWKKSPPLSQKPVKSADPNDIERARRQFKKSQNLSVREKLLREFSCSICRQVMISPVTTPCAHNFCKSCLEAKFKGQSFVKDRSRGGRSLRTQKNVMKCPLCCLDIADFLQNIQVNTELMGLIESLKAKAEEENGEPVDSSDDGCDENGAEKDDENKASDEVTQDPLIEPEQNSSEENKISEEKKNGSTEELEVANEVTVAEGKPNKKRKKAGEQCPTRARGKKAKKVKKAKEEGADEGNDSPSSPLHLPADN